MIGARFVPNVAQAQKSLWTHPMLLLGDEARVKGRFGQFGYSANFYARQVYSLSQMHHYAWKSFRTHPMELLGDMGHVESRIGPFGHGVSVDGR
jgi:hypothetical protein